MQRSVAALVLSFVACTAPAHALTWEALGPFGGDTRAVVVNPLRDVVYASQGSLFYSENQGETWTAASPFPNCAGVNAWAPRARSDGDVFVTCGRVFRSRDDGRTWTVYLDTDFSTAYGPLTFDPTRIERAVIRLVDAIHATENDGATWTAIPQPGLAPRVFAFDPRRSGRLVAVNTEYHPGGIATTNTSVVLKESFDSGRNWRTVNTIFPVRPTFCIGRQLVFGATGTLFVSTTCGAYRSADGGASWKAVGASPEQNVRGFATDPSRPAHVLAWADDRIIESQDDGETWHLLPAPPASIFAETGGGDSIAVTPHGQVLVATAAGIHALDRGTQSWQARVLGVQGVRVSSFEIVAGQPPRFLVPSYSEPAMTSADGGLTWLPWRIDGVDVRHVYPNLTVPSSILASTDDGALHRSPNGGRTWTSVALPPDPEQPDNVITGIVPVGPQPGLVYGLSGICRHNFIGCRWTPRNVVRSSDGGTSWTSTLTTGAAGDNDVAFQLAVSPADTSLVLVSTATAVHRTRNGGKTWETLAPVVGRLVADPVESARWYAMSSSGRLRRSIDFGTTWTAVDLPTTAGYFTDLLVDSLQPARLYLIASDGAVSMSEDRGDHWRMLVSASNALIHGARLSPLAGNAIYAGSDGGLLKLPLRAASVPAAIPLVEFYRADLDHYFMSADAAEIAVLDERARAGGPFVRTGQVLNVWPASAVDDEAASVCRFYGKPEAQLDTHFFTASPTECEVVISRFAGSWILESPRIFSVALPDVFGRCGGGTISVYRLFNGRPDVNHRYTTSASLRSDMQRSGWIAEGYGPDGVVMCSPR